MCSATPPVLRSFFPHGCNVAAEAPRHLSSQHSFQEKNRKGSGKGTSPIPVFGGEPFLEVQSDSSSVSVAGGEPQIPYCIYPLHLPSLPWTDWDPFLGPTGTVLPGKKSAVVSQQ